MAGGGGWADLPLDLFSLIFSKLSPPQFLRSAAVCVSWSAAVRHLSTLDGCFKFRGQSPWLMLNNNPPSGITFYAFDERRSYTVPVPDPPINDRLCLGSAHGWIITIDARHCVQLLNPITGAQIDLPRLLPFRDFTGRLVNCTVSKPVIHDAALERYRLAILSADPSLGDGYTVAILQHFDGRIFFTRCGDEQWFDLRNPISVKNIVFHKGKLYMSALSEVYVCDLDEAQTQIEHSEMPRFRIVDRALHRDDIHYLLETSRGDLLSIWRQRNENLTISVKIHKVVIDEEEEKQQSKRLEKTMDLGEFIISLGGNRVVVDHEILSIRLGAKELGDCIIFLGGRNPLCFSACDLPLSTPNSIYFTDDDLIRNPVERVRSLQQQKWFHTRHLQRFTPYVLPSTRSRLYWKPPSSSIN
ncbi:putative F-box protein At4g22170 [Curcuma longa]|uniref:putative F-box protein At4g22170 n=1 Tax=Curcuma longa TaxID=136217 RepID=UPI003D9E73C5